MESGHAIPLFNILQRLPTQNKCQILSMDHKTQSNLPVAAWAQLSPLGPLLTPLWPHWPPCWSVHRPHFCSGSLHWLFFSLKCSFSDIPSLLPSLCLNVFLPSYLKFHLHHVLLIPFLALYPSKHLLSPYRGELYLLLIYRVCCPAPSTRTWEA